MKCVHSMSYALVPGRRFVHHNIYTVSSSKHLCHIKNQKFIHQPFLLKHVYRFYIPHMLCTVLYVTCIYVRCTTIFPRETSVPIYHSYPPHPLDHYPITHASSHIVHSCIHPPHHSRLSKGGTQDPFEVPLYPHLSCRHAHTQAVNCS